MRRRMIEFRHRRCAKSFGTRCTNTHSGCASQGRRSSCRRTPVVRIHAAANDIQHHEYRAGQWPASNAPLPQSDFVLHRSSLHSDPSPHGISTSPSASASASSRRTCLCSVRHRCSHCNHSSLRARVKKQFRLSWNARSGSQKIIPAHTWFQSALRLRAESAQASN